MQYLCIYLPNEATFFLNESGSATMTFLPLGGRLGTGIISAELCTCRCHRICATNEQICFVHLRIVFVHSQLCSLCIDAFAVAFARVLCAFAVVHLQLCILCTNAFAVAFAHFRCAFAVVHLRLWLCSCAFVFAHLRKFSAPSFWNSATHSIQFNSVSFSSVQFSSVQFSSVQRREISHINRSAPVRASVLGLPGTLVIVGGSNLGCC